jgi:hypothetical protein
VPFAPPPDVILLDQPREYHRFWNAVVHPSMTSAELDWMRNVVRRNPAAPSAMLRYALAAGLNGREQESAAMLRAICHIHPPARCDEARESWRSAQGAHPSLVAVPGP